MKVVNKALLLVFLLLVVALGSGFAQSIRIDGGSVSQEKFGFYFETRLDPPAPPMSGFSSSTTHDPGIIHRIMYDRPRNIFVGYDAVIEALEEPNTYRVTFRKLTMTPQLTREFGGDQWSQMPTPGWNLAPQVIRAGDVLSIDLLVNGATKQRVVDYVTVQEPNRRFNGFNPLPERQFSFVPGPSRDFKTDDAELIIKAPRLNINGKMEETSTRPFQEVSGPIVWIYVPNRGRFLLSLLPRPSLGFRKAGEIHGSSLSFAIGSTTFGLSTGGPIAPGQVSYNLYVLHQPDWKPTYENANLSVFNMGTASPAELTPRK